MSPFGSRAMTIFPPSIASVELEAARGLAEHEPCRRRAQQGADECVRALLSVVAVRMRVAHALGGGLAVRSRPRSGYRCMPRVIPRL